MRLKHAPAPSVPAMAEDPPSHPASCPTVTPVPPSGAAGTTGETGAAEEAGPAGRPGTAELPELLVGAARSLRRAWVGALEPHGLSPHQARALRAVVGPWRGDRPGAGTGHAGPGDAGTGPGRRSGGTEQRDGLRVSDLASALRIAPRSATEVVDGLEERGLVVRASDPADRRAVVLRASDAGRALSRDVEVARARGGEALLARLGADDRVELARLLRLLLADEEADPRRPEPRR
ncbi:MarR family transcriptional regulator [Pseudokineococcus basanitobsidens]|uniref:MarR family transcriptional regulator n=1 Tax=Pseudokineococcus basanitobsidens TaxID=1926649 RepID=A0ABU8RFD6_9ACTN